jgi:polyhydroxybutyrate depolymerase
VPLVLMTHGLTGNATREEEASDFDVMAERYGWLVAYPQALQLRGVTSWNAGTCCGPAVTAGVNDVAYLHALIRDVQARYAITRVIYAGMSNGGMLGYRLVCEHTDWVDAVVVLSGSRVVDDCAPSRAVPVLHMHGMADPVVPVAGSAYLARLNTPLRAPIASLEPIAQRNGCRGWTITIDPDTGLQTWDAIGCRASAPVQLVLIRGLDHGVTRNVSRYGIDEVAYIWRWLEHQVR